MLRNLFQGLGLPRRTDQETRGARIHLTPQKFATVRQSVFFKITPLELYHAILDPEKREEWTGQRATGLGKIGNTFTTTDGYVFGKNLELKEGRIIVQEWKTKEWPDGAPFSLVRYSFRRQKGGTRLSLNHSRVPSSLKDYVASGWVEYNWKPLKKYFSRNDTGSRTNC